MEDRKDKEQKSKRQKIYEDDNYVIDKIHDGFIISLFEDSHYVDEIVITEDSFYEDY